MWSFCISFFSRLKKVLNKHWMRRWLERPWCSCSIKVINLVLVMAIQRKLCKLFNLHPLITNQFHVSSSFFTCKWLYPLRMYIKASYFPQHCQMERSISSFHKSEYTSYRLLSQSIETRYLCMMTLWQGQTFRITGPMTLLELFDRSFWNFDTWGYVLKTRTGP